MAFVDERKEPRFGRGIDHGSDARVLAERATDDGVVRLVWCKGFRIANAGVRGFGHRYVPACLALRGPRFAESLTLGEGGRLSLAAVRAHAARIDVAMGEGVADAVSPGRTLVVTR